jgi:hypothetical protein
MKLYYTLAQVPELADHRIRPQNQQDQSHTYTFHKRGNSRDIHERGNLNWGAFGVAPEWLTVCNDPPYGGTRHVRVFLGGG